VTSAWQPALRSESPPNSKSGARPASASASRARACSASTSAHPSRSGAADTTRTSPAAGARLAQRPGHRQPEPLRVTLLPPRRHPRRPPRQPGPGDPRPQQHRLAAARRRRHHRHPRRPPEQLKQGRPGHQSVRTTAGHGAWLRGFHSHDNPTASTILLRPVLAVNLPPGRMSGNHPVGAIPGRSKPAGLSECRHGSFGKSKELSRTDQQWLDRLSRPGSAWRARGFAPRRRRGRPGRSRPGGWRPRRPGRTRSPPVPGRAVPLDPLARTSPAFDADGA
jgi:hypothetical protein